MTDRADIRGARRSVTFAGALLLALALLEFHRHRNIAAAIAGILAATALGSLGSPVLTLGFRAGWRRMGAALGYVNTRLLLGAFFFLVITPLGILLRLLGRDPLDRRSGAKASQWIPRLRTRPEPGDFEHLF